MAIFEGLQLGGRETISKAAQAIEACLNELPGEGPYSLCEIVTEPRDFLWLQRWATDIKPCYVKQEVTKAGLVLMLLASEVARRDATEKLVWPPFRRKFGANAQRSLFSGESGQPTALLKDSLERAAEYYRLRNVFGIQGMQNWYVSIYLQFGFTYRGMSRQLPYWLSMHAMTQSVQHLLEGDLKSDSFRRMWEGLRNYRRDYITEGQLRGILGQSPWVLRSWHSDLIELAKTKLHLEQAKTDEEEQVVPFLSAPVLCWEGLDAPFFRARLVELGQQSLDADHYRLECGGETLATLFQQADGTEEPYRADRSEAEIRFRHPIVAFSLLGPDGEVAACQSFQLWDPADLVNVFDLKSGSRLPDSDRSPMHQARPFALLVPDDLKVLPEPAWWYRISDNLVLYRVPAGWDADLRVEDGEGRLVWQPLLQQIRKPPPDPHRATGVQVRCLGGRHKTLGQSLRLQVTGLPEGARLTFVRLGTTPLRFDPSSGLVEQVELTPELAMAGLKVRLGIDNGTETTVLRRTLDAVEFRGLALFQKSGWETFTPNGQLSVRKANGCPARLFLGDDLPGRAAKIALLEGGIFAGWRAESSRGLGRLTGLGGPLVARKQPYNCTDNILTLASAVLDHGLMKYAELTPEARLLRLSFYDPIEPAPDYEVLIVNAAGEIRRVGHDEIVALGPLNDWYLECEAEEGAGLFICLAFRGGRLGARWIGRLGHLVGSWTEGAADPLALAALTRWGLFPVALQERGTGQFVFETFLRCHPAEVLSAWLLDEGLSEGLEFQESAEVTEARWAAFRQMTDEWTPAPEQVKAIIESLGKSHPEMPLVDAIPEVLAIAPLFAARLLFVWLTEIESEPYGMPAKQFLVQFRNFANAQSTGSGSKGPDAFEEEFLATAVRKMGGANRDSSVDETFVKIGIADPAIASLRGHSMNPVGKENVAQAMQIASFREYLGMRVLRELVASF